MVFKIWHPFSEVRREDEDGADEDDGGLQAEALRLDIMRIEALHAEYLAEREQMISLLADTRNDIVNEPVPAKLSDCLSPIFYFDYSKWPTFFRRFVTTTGNRATLPFVMPLLALLELLIFAYNTVDFGNGRLDINWKLNADWARLDVNKPKQFWRSFTLVFNGSGYQLLLNCILHATFGVILEIFNGTLPLLLVNLGNFFAVWFTSYFLVSEKSASQLPLDGLANDFENHSEKLRIIAWIAMYNLVMANWIMNRRFLSTKVCLPVFLLGARFIVYGIFDSLLAPTFRPTSYIISSAFIGSFLVSFIGALFAIPEDSRSYWKKATSYISIIVYMLVVLLVWGIMLIHHGDLK